MTFQLDTTGAVAMGSEHGPQYARVNLVWSDLSPFAQGYIEALFASVRVDALGATYAERPALLPRFSDLAPETLARIIADCEAMERNKGKPGTRENGADCWAGRQEGRKPGDYAPHPFPPLTVQLCDDGKVRLA